MSTAAHSAIRSATAGVVLLFLATPVQAAIIDDYVDPAQYTSPDLDNEYVLTENVGEFDALRRIRIFGSRAQPEGEIAVGASKYEATVSTTNVFLPGPTISVQAEYIFAFDLVNGVKDLTEGGVNNAFIFDFSRLTASTELGFFRMLASEDQGVWESRMSLPLQDSPFRIVVPFDSFSSRGGGIAGKPSFTSVASVDWTLRLSDNAFVLPDDLQFNLTLDQVSVGRVPEPSTLVTMVIAVILIARLT